MTNKDKPPEVVQVACDICLKEVPLTEATIPEAADYFVHFCGLACYDKWQHLDDSQKEKFKKAGA